MLMLLVRHHLQVADGDDAPNFDRLFINYSSVEAQGLSNAALVLEPLNDE